MAADVLAKVGTGTPAREIAVLFRINAQSEAFEEALAARGVPYVVRGAARFFERAEVKQAVSLLRGSARTGDAGAEGDDLVAATRAVLTGMGWSEAAPAGSRQRPRPVGVAAGDRLPGPRHADGPARRRPGHVRRRARPPGRRAARPGRRGGDARDAACRQGARVGRRLRGRHAGRLDADRARRGSRGDRGGAQAALRRHDPGPPRADGVVVPRPQPRRARVSQAVALPRRAAARERLRHGGRRAGQGWPPPQGRGPLPRVRQAARHDRRAQGRQVCRLPGVVRRAAVRATPRVAGRQGIGGEGACLRRVHRPDAAGDRRGQARRPDRVCCASTGSVSPSSRSTATTCSRWWPAASSRPARASDLGKTHKIDCRLPIHRCSFFVPAPHARGGDPQ